MWYVQQKYLNICICVFCVLVYLCICWYLYKNIKVSHFQAVADSSNAIAAHWVKPKNISKKVLRKQHIWKVKALSDFQITFERVFMISAVCRFMLWLITCKDLVPKQNFSFLLFLSFEHWCTVCFVIFVGFCFPRFSL